METRTYKVYKFSELSEEGKQKALDNLRNSNVGDDWWEQDGLLDLSAKEMKRIKVRINRCRVKDDNGNSIGSYPDYTCLVMYKVKAFDLDRGQYLQFSDIEIMNEDIFRKFLRMPKKLWSKVDYSFENSGEQNTKIEFTENDSDFSPQEDEILDRAQEIFSGKVHDAWVSLRDQFNYLLSDDGVKEMIETNDYWLTEDGKIG